jgi:DNA-binding transcriptional LysR family regulator
MEHPSSRLDWNQLRAFLETAEAGSLSGAARQLGSSQPTLSRQVAALEQQLGVTLFERAGRSLVLTGAGLALLEHARAMGAAADGLQLVASGQSQTVEGVVGVSVSDAVAVWLLPGVLARLREQAPGIVIDVVASDALSDLRRREADIAVRHVRPDQPDLIGRWIRDATASFYASQDWVRRHGHPRQAAEAASLGFVGGDRAGRDLAYLQQHGLAVQAGNFTCLAESSAATWAMVRAGLGIGPMMDEVAQGMPDVVRVLDDVPLLRFPIWLVTHRELRTSRRIRVVFDALAGALAAPLEPARGTPTAGPRPAPARRPRERAR